MIHISVVVDMTDEDYTISEHLGDEYEYIEGCNCIYCRMARMEKKMQELNRSLNLVITEIQATEEKKVKNEP